MKLWKISNSVLLGLTLLAATTGSACTKSSQNKGSLNIQEPVTVNGIRLAMGNYRELHGSGTDCDVESISSNPERSWRPCRRSWLI